MKSDLKTILWETAARVHDDVRVAGFLRALSVVGMVGGFVSFFVGVNPLVALAVLPLVPFDGATMLKLGILGLLVYSVSLLYYTATKTSDDGLLRL